jgi:hypothetical protein
MSLTKLEKEIRALSSDEFHVRYAALLDRMRPTSDDIRQAIDIVRRNAPALPAVLGNPEALHKLMMMDAQSFAAIRLSEEGQLSREDNAVIRESLRRGRLAQTGTRRLFDA